MGNKPDAGRQGMAKFQKTARHVIACRHKADRRELFARDPRGGFFRIATRAVRRITKGDTAFQVARRPLGKPEQRLNIDPPIHTGDEQFLRDAFFEKRQAFTDPARPAGQHNNRVGFLLRGVLRDGYMRREQVQPRRPNEECDAAPQKQAAESPERPSLLWMFHIIFPSTRFTVIPTVKTTSRTAATGSPASSAHCAGDRTSSGSRPPLSPAP